MHWRTNIISIIGDSHLYRSSTVVSAFSCIWDEGLRVVHHSNQFVVKLDQRRLNSEIISGRVQCANGVACYMKSWLHGLKILKTKHCGPVLVSGRYEAGVGRDVSLPSSRMCEGVCASASWPTKLFNGRQEIPRGWFTPQ